MRTCRKCGNPPASDRVMKRDWLCRECSIQYKKEWRAKRRAANKSVSGTVVAVGWRKAYMSQPEQRRRSATRQRTRNAVKRGDIHKVPCWCGSLQVEAHHTDYSDHLNVIWLCHKHHAITWRAEGK